MGQAWPPKAGSQLAPPAALHELLIGLLEALGRGDLVRFLVQRAALFVPALVERE